jgi:hypothetical protein
MRAVDLDQVAGLARHAGDQAVIEEAGGNTAVLYAGHRYIGPERWARWSVAADPGWFRGPGQTRPAADNTDFRHRPRRRRRLAAQSARRNGRR